MSRSLIILCVCIASIAGALYFYSLDRGLPKGPASDGPAFPELAGQTGAAALVSPLDAAEAPNPLIPFELPFEPEAWSDVQIGEPIRFFLPPEQRMVNLTASEVRQSPAGNLLITADHQGEGYYHRLILTVGKYQTFGTLQTDRNRYQFELTDGVGEMVAASDLQPKSAAADKDYIIRERAFEPPITRQKVNQ